MRFSPIIWDVDGTILDSGAEIFERVTRVVELLKYPALDQAQLRRFIGPPLIESFEKIAGMTPADAKLATQHTRAMAEDLPPDYLVSLYPGVAELIQQLHSLGVPQAVASSKAQWQVERGLEHFGLADCFVSLWGADIPAGRIHKHEMIAGAVADLTAAGFDAAGGVMIGDRIHDLEGAARFGLPTIIVEWGFGDGEKTPGAYGRASSAAELQRMLEL